MVESTTLDHESTSSLALNTKSSADFVNSHSIIQEEREALEQEQADTDSEKAEKASV